MPELLRLAQCIRCVSPSPSQIFIHRLRIGLLVAALILLLSLLR